MMKMKMMVYRTLLAISFFGLGISKVLIKQGSLQEKHEVGASAILYCNITTDTEVLTRCRMMWEIWNELQKSATEISVVPKYQKRINVMPHGTTSLLTIQDLESTDTEEILCLGKCFVNGQLEYIHGNGTILTITDKSNKEQGKEPKLPWLKYLIFSINFLILTISVVVLISIIRKKFKPKCSQSQMKL